MLADFLCGAPICVLAIVCLLLTSARFRALTGSARALDSKDMRIVYIFVAVFLAAGLRLMAHAMGVANVG